MAYQLVWSAEAEDDFKKIVLFIKDTWSIQSSKKFIANTNRKIEQLARMPTTARRTNQQFVYMHRLDRKNALFFSLEGNYLILLSIYPYKKDITKSKYF
ncbi:MAG: type II toxin-antitoxin system RelE/ParE family toxin [Bacteroidota bacterium]|nr:type II toxin-antitoxin system RelE/ParE family toxin [Bacteroidota bacterium]